MSKDLLYTCATKRVGLGNIENHGLDSGLEEETTPKGRELIVYSYNKII